VSVKDEIRTNRSANTDHANLSPHC